MSPGAREKEKKCLQVQKHLDLEEENLERFAEKRNI
jgi:hypothetical protein